MTKVFLLVFFLLSVATASHMEMMDEDLETEDRHIKMIDKDLETEDSLWNLYERWISHNNVSRDPDEKQKRFKVFKDNARAIHQFNKRDDMSYKKAINMFADMTDEEFSATKTGFVIRRRRSHSRSRSHSRNARLGGVFALELDTGPGEIRNRGSMLLC